MQSQHACKTLATEQCASCKFLQKLHSVGHQLFSVYHSVGRQPDAICIRLAAMQYKIPKFINSLHEAGDQPNEICIRLAATQMQILQKKQLAHF
jgi:hypothetical protein